MSEPTAPEAAAAPPPEDPPLGPATAGDSTLRDPAMGDAVGADDIAIPDDAAMRRAEEKPPLYRYVRGSVYVAYMLVVVWFVLGVVLAAYRSVWSPEGEALRRAELQRGQQRSGEDPQKPR